MSIEDLQEHSPVGPSSGERWIFCAGSVAVTQHLPDVSSIYADEGTFAHYVSQLCREQGKDAKEFFGLTSDCGRFTCDKEMVAGVQDFLDYCDQFPGDVFIEQRVHYAEDVENGFGTADHIALDADSKTCYVIDLKYGTGNQIFAKGNIQLKLYALGVLRDMGFMYDIEKFVLCISQPRLKHRDQWEISTEKLLRWVEEKVDPAGKRVYEAIKLLQRSDVQKKITAGSSLQAIAPDYFRAGAWCQWCKVRGECLTRTKMVREAALAEVDELDDLDAFEDPGVRDVGAMTDEQLGEAAVLIEQIKKWCGDIEATLEKRVMAGHKIPSGFDFNGEPEYFKMVVGRSNRTWRDEAEAEAAMKRYRIKAADMYTKKLITMPAAETLLGAKHPLFTKNDLVHKPKGKPTLAPGYDPRPEYRVGTDELDDIDDDADFLDI